jgi:hypothetical protein
LSRRINVVCDTDVSRTAFLASDEARSITGVTLPVEPGACATKRGHR